MYLMEKRFSLFCISSSKEIWSYVEHTCVCQGEGGIGEGHTGSLGLADVNFFVFAF